MYKWIVSTGLVCLMAAPATGTTIRAQSIEQMAQKATEIVEGTISDVQSFDASGAINTRVTVTVSKDHRAPDDRATARAGEALVFVTPGGQRGEFAQMVPGTPTFSKGDRVLVFLWRDQPAAPLRLLGLTQGTYRLTPSPGGEVATSDRRGIRRVQSATGGMREVHEDPDAKLPAAALRSRIRQALRTSAPSASPATPEVGR